MPRFLLVAFAFFLAGCAFDPNGRFVHSTAGSTFLANMFADPNDFGFAPGPPPPPLQEIIPRPPSGNVVWIPGHWDWTGLQWNWIRGRYVRASDAAIISTTGTVRTQGVNTK